MISTFPDLIKSYSTQELLFILFQKEDYQPDSIAAVEAELNSRGISETERYETRLAWTLQQDDETVRKKSRLDRKIISGSRSIALSMNPWNKTGADQIILLIIISATLYLLTALMPVLDSFLLMIRFDQVR